MLSLPSCGASRDKRLGHAARGSIKAARGNMKAMDQMLADLKLNPVQGRTSCRPVGGAGKLNLFRSAKFLF